MKANIIFSYSFEYILVNKLMFVSNSEDPLHAEITGKILWSVYAKSSV